MKAKTKWLGVPGQTKGILNSTNFLVSVLTLVFLPFIDNGLDIEAAATADSLFDAFASGDITIILSVLALNVVQPVIKWIQNAWNGWSWAFLRSWNFWTQAITVALMFVASYGLVFPEDAIFNVVEAIQTGQFDVISLAILINIVNPIYHWVKTFFLDN